MLRVMSLQEEKYSDSESEIKNTFIFFNITCYKMIDDKHLLKIF